MISGENSFFQHLTSFACKAINYSGLSCVTYASLDVGGSHIID